MKLKSKGFSLIEALMTLLVLAILGLNINKFIISVSYLSYKLHYKSKAMLLISNYINIMKLSPSGSDKFYLIQRFNKEVSSSLPNGKFYSSEKLLKLVWDSIGSEDFDSYTVKIKSKGFVLVESLGYLMIINLILMSSLYFFSNFNKAYTSQKQLSLLDDAFDLSKSYLENDLKKCLEVNISKDKSSIYINKNYKGVNSTITYKVMKKPNNLSGLYRAENHHRFQEVASNIENTTYEIYDLKIGVNKLVILKVCAKIDNVNESREIMLKL